MFGENSTLHVTEYHFIFSSMEVAASCYAYAWESLPKMCNKGYEEFVKEL
jgi:hypothetical protein